MTLPILFAIISCLFFGSIAIFFSLKEEKLKKILDAEYKSQKKDDFINAVVHEMRAPLTAIKGAAELIANQDGKLSLEEQKKLLNIITELSKRLLGEISTLLDAAKLKSGEFSIQKARSSINDVITERIAFFTPEAIEKHIELTKEVANDVPFVSMDAFRIGEVINNLLSNSLKFTQANGKIKVGAKKVDNSILVFVMDNGIGIPKEKQDNLFKKFYEVDNKQNHGSSNADMHGTGLGLYILKGIIEAHGGKVELLSEEGIGTTVSFTLPLDQNISHTEIINEPISKTLGRTIN